MGRSESRAETRRKRDYGRFTVESERNQWEAEWFVVDGMDRRWSTGPGKEGRKNAQALAAALDAAECLDVGILPDTSSGLSERGEWEQWVDHTDAVPADIVGAGKPAVAAFLAAVHETPESTISDRLNVSEQSVRQYLSDLRAGRV